LETVFPINYGWYFGEIASSIHTKFTTRVTNNNGGPMFWLLKSFLVVSNYSVFIGNGIENSVQYAQRTSGDLTR
jgi:hypothetical protein